MKPWEVKQTLKLYRRMSGSRSVELGAEITEAAIKMFASSLGKRPSREVYELLWEENEWLSKRLRGKRLRP